MGQCFRAVHPKKEKPPPWAGGGRVTARIAYGGRRASGETFSEPCAAPACGRLHRGGRAGGAAWSENVLPCRNFPRRFLPQSGAWGGWAARGVLPRRRRVDRVEPRGRGPFSRGFRWPEPCGHFQPARCNSEEDRCASRCPLETVFFPRANCGGGRR